MDKKTIVISVLLSVLLVLIVVILYYKFIVRGTTVSSSTYTSSSTSCNISCPPGYEVDPLTCQCSPLVPAAIQVQPNPFFNIRLWLAVGTICLGSSCLEVLTPPSDCIALGKACMGFHPEWTSCCPPAPSVPCTYCDPKYGCNPETAETSGTLTFTGQVLSSNGTPIPNTKVNVQSPFPKTYTLSGYCGGIGLFTVTLTLYPPPSTVTTDESGTFTVTVPFKAVLTGLSPNAFADPLTCLCVGGQASYTYNIGPPFEFILSIPNSTISTTAVVPYNLSICFNQEAHAPGVL